MGLDISAHAVDVALFRDRLAPFLLEGEPIDDLIDRAARVAKAQARANAWGLAMVDASHALFDAQRKVARKSMEQVDVKGPEPGPMARLFGVKAAVRKERREVTERVPGLPGFDSDRDVWGRPFFIAGPDSAQAIADLDRYLEAAASGEAAVDDLAREMLARLEAMRTAIPPDVPDHLAATIRAMAPLTALRPASRANGAADAPSFDLEACKRSLARRAALWRDVVKTDDLDAEIALDDEDGEDEEGFEPDTLTIREAQASLPLELMSFAAMLLPGWMGRGYVYATHLLDKVRVRSSDLFDAPEALFAPVMKRAPALREGLHTTIIENFCLGGYVPPEKVGALVDRLEANRDALILAWTEPHERAALTPAQIEEMSTDYLKIIEPARYALEHGHGYIEAAEIYSGPLGAMN